MSELKYWGLDASFNIIRFRISQNRSRPQVPHIHRNRVLSEEWGIAMLGITNRKVVMHMCDWFFKVSLLEERSWTERGAGSKGFENQSNLESKPPVQNGSCSGLEGWQRHFWFKKSPTGLHLESQEN